MSIFSPKNDIEPLCLGKIGSFQPLTEAIFVIVKCHFVKVCLKMADLSPARWLHIILSPLKMETCY